MIQTLQSVMMICIRLDAAEAGDLRYFYRFMIESIQITDEEKNVVLLHCKRVRFGVQKESFYTSKGVLLEGKRTPFEKQP